MAALLKLETLLNDKLPKSERTLVLGASISIIQEMIEVLEKQVTLVEGLPITEEQSKDYLEQHLRVLNLIKDLLALLHFANGSVAA
jgi:hypothetical protein